MKVGSLFSGIGGLDLGLERAGMSVAWQVERDPYCLAVLRKHWPDVTRYTSVEGFLASIEQPPDQSYLDWLTVELVCGGFPCQPVSRAGRRKGTDDERWLWPEMARVVRILRPRYVLVENVPGLFTHGMGEVLGDLAGLGFDAEWESIPAAAVGAPHLRDRVFIIAWSEHGRALADSGGRRGPGDGLRTGRDEPGESGSDMAYADSRGRRANGVGRGMAEVGERGPDESVPAQERCADVAHASSDRRVQRGAEPTRFFGPPRPERSSGWEVEPDMGRVAHGIPSRVDRLRGLGNAVVPQVAEWIGRGIMSASDDFRREDA